MGSFRMTETTKLEYRQTGTTRAINVILVVMLFFVGISSFYVFATSFRYMPGIALALLIIAGDIYYLATVLRSRILVTGTQIKIRNALGERTADLTEIEGVRNIYGKYGGSVTGKLLCLKAGRGTMTIPMMAFDLDDRFSDWLKQLPDLDERGR